MNRKHYSHKSHGGGGAKIDRAGHLSDHDEYRDLNFRAIGQFFVGLAVIIAISYVGMYGILKLFESQYEENDAPPPPTAASPGWDAPAIDVQTSPHVDLVEFRETEAEVLSEVDPARRKLSIDEAIDATLEEGLPYRKAMDGTMNDDGEANAESASDDEGNDENASEESGEN